VKLSLLAVVLSQFAAASCFVLIMWCSCDMILFNLIYLFIADTKSIVWTHTLCRTQVDETDNAERSTRHWSRRNPRVTDTFCNYIEDRTI